MFKNMRLGILFDMFLNPSFKLTRSFANIARTTASTSKFKDPISDDLKSFLVYKFTCASCFKLIDKANFKFDLKIKEALHINWRKTNLNARQNHLALALLL